MSALSDLQALSSAKRAKDPTDPDLPILGAAITALANAEDRVSRLEPVLAWYADPGTWIRVPAYTQAAADKGARARAVLPQTEA